MKKILYILILGLFTTGFMTGCQSEDEFGGEGKVSFKVTIDNDVDVIARTGEEDLMNNCTIYVYNSKHLIRKYHGINELPAELVLVSGEYKAEAWAGDSVPASFTAKYFKGNTPFTIAKGSNVKAEIVCKISNVVASVNFKPVVAEVLSNYKLTIGHSKGTLDFTAENAATAKGYYMMPEGEKDLTWKITGTMVNGQEFTQEGVIADVKRGHEYAMTIDYNPVTHDFGGALLTVEVDESTIDVENSIILKAAPKITGSGFDVNEPVYGEMQSFRKMSLYISGTAALKGLELSCNSFQELGLPANNFDLMMVAESVKSQINAAGISHTYTYDDVKDESMTKLIFAKTFMDKLKNGSYPITVKATDANGKVSTKVLQIEVSDASVVTLPIAPADVNQYSATVRGNIAKEGVTVCGFNYRKMGDVEWISVPAEISGSTFFAKLTGLTPNTTYQFAATTTDYVSSQVFEFTTGLVIPLVNGGFEDWSNASSGALIPSASGKLYWDTGNHGSITMNKNVTTPDETVKHGGAKSVKMESQFVGLAGIGKFAAGNMFLGKYLNTEGTNGVLGFGRPFNARPKALHGYVKYISGNIDYKSNEVPEATGQDKGILYIALLDGTTENYSKSGMNETWPVIIKTKKSERRLFSKNDANVIGYGEQIWSASTEGAGMIEFTIPIEYFKADTPVNIMIVASASFWGDYFVGSTSSKMWLDDLELIYE